jgi:hypothetical protein
VTSRWSPSTVPIQNRTSPNRRREPAGWSPSLYDNFWYTNFQGDSPGVMEFQFDLAWRGQLPGDHEAATLAESLNVEPVMVINPAQPEHPLFLQHLFRP